MVDANKKDKAPKSELISGKDGTEKDEAPINSSNNMEEEEEEYDDDEDEFDEDEYDDEEEEDEEEEEEYDDQEEEPEEEKVNNGGNAVAVDNNGGTETTKENAVKEVEKKAEEPKTHKKSGEDIKSKEKRPRNTNRKEDEPNDSGNMAVNGDKPESSKRKRASKRAETMGMVFMCSSKTKTDCFRYKILGLPESKKDQVLKIYKGMRLFLFDVDLRLMYGIFKAAGPGGYNIEPEAFKSEFPSQVRFTVLDDCLPLAEEKFKSILKENYYSRNKFEGLLKPEQVKKLCRLFLETIKGRGRPKFAAKRRRTGRRTRRDESSRRSRIRIDDRHRSRSREERKRRARDEERRRRPRPRSRSPPPRDRERRYRSPVLYDREREAHVPRHHLPQPTVMGSPVRLYTYERQPVDVSSYVHGHVPQPHPYPVVDRVPEPLPYRVADRDRDRDRDRDPYLAYSREPPLYRDPVYTTVPPEYHLVRRDYPHPHPYAVQPSEYRHSGGSRVEIPSEYRSSALALPESRSRTHYRY